MWALSHPRGSGHGLSEHFDCLARRCDLAGVKQIIGPDDELLRESIQKHEGFVPVVYDDDDGKPLQKGATLKGYATVGYGRNLHQPMSQIEADMMLRNDIGRSYLEAGKFEWWFKLNPTRQRVIVEMLFNLGLTRFKTFKNAISRLEAGMFEAASRELLDSLWAKQVGPRAVTLAAMMRTGEMP